MLFDLLSQTYLIDAIEPLLIYVGIAFFAIIVVIGVICALVSKENFSYVLNKLLFALFIFSLIMGGAFLVLKLSKKFDGEYLKDSYVDKSIITLVLIPLVITLFITLCGALINYVASQKNLKQKGIIKTASLSVIALSIVASLVCMLVYFNAHIDGDGYYTGESAYFNAPSLWISAALMIATSFFLAFSLDRDGNLNFTPKDISFAGESIATSLALSYIRLFRLTNGGSITLVSMLPVMLFAYSRGLKKGLFAGLIYGLLQSIQDPFIIHPAQFLLDYPLAFTMLGLAAVGAKLKKNKDNVKFAVGAAIAGVMRYISHVLSGIFAFGAYADGANVFLFSVGYNSFVLIDTVLVIIAGVLLTSNANFNKTVLKK